MNNKNTSTNWSFTENDLTDEELERRHKLQQASFLTDNWDRLEELRVLLNSSKIEQMRYFHTHSTIGRECSYYQKAKQIFERDEKSKILELMKIILEDVFPDKKNQEEKP